MRARAIGAGDAWPGAVAARQSRAARVAPVLLLALLLGLAFRGVLAGRVFYLRDAVQNHGPLRALVGERLRAGEWPLWNPYHGAGTPLLANPNALALHPTTLFYLVLPPDAAFTASVIVLTALLALGGFLLARAIGARSEGAALAGAVLALSGPAASLASMQNVHAAFAFVPIALWALRRAAEIPRPGRVVCAGLLLAPVLIAAEPASLLAYLTIGAVLLLARDGEDAPGAPPRRAALILGATLGLACLLAAPQILAARELLPLTPRASGFLPAEGMKWSLLPVRLLEMVVPRLFGDPTRLSPGAWWGRFAFEGGYPFFLSLYLGAIPCLLAVTGVLAGGAGRRRRRLLGAAGAVGILLALGGHAVVYRSLYAALPPLRQIRYPERFLLLAVLAVALLAAVGLDRILERAVDRRAVLRLLVAAPAAAFVAVSCVAAAPALVDAFLTRHAAVPEALFAAAPGAVVRGAVLTSALCLLVETLLLTLWAAWALHPGAPAPRALAHGLVAVCGLSMLLGAAPALSTAAPGWIDAASPLREVVGHGPDAPRLRHEPRPADLSVWARTDEIVWGFRFDRFSYSLLTGHRDGVPTVFDAATDRMDLKRQVDLGKALNGLPLGDTVKILRVAHAGFLLSHEPLADPDLEAGPILDGFSRPPLRLFRVLRPLPRVRFRSRARVAAWPGDPARSLADRGYDPDREVLFDMLPPMTAASTAARAPTAAPAPTAAAPRTGDDPRVSILEDRPERLRLRVAAPEPGWVVVADAWAPGWTAVVDGSPATVLQADGMFRAVALGAGEHEVLMVYAPRGPRRGAWLFGAGILISAVSVAAGARRRRA